MGITKEVIRDGTGAYPVRGQKVTVHCTGYGKNRDMTLQFWSTKDPGQKVFAFTIGLGQVIKGWDEGVMGMVSNLMAPLLIFIPCDLIRKSGRSPDLPAVLIMPTARTGFQPGE